MRLVETIGPARARSRHHVANQLGPQTQRRACDRPPKRRRGELLALASEVIAFGMRNGELGFRCWTVIGANNQDPRQDQNRCATQYEKKSRLLHTPLEPPVRRARPSVY